MKYLKHIFLALILMAAFHSADAGVSFTIGTDDFYLSVGDYDYLPYAFVSSPSYVPQRISFYDALNDYGQWVEISAFGPAWVPYASRGWRPYTQGRWIWTSHGWYWQAYEPWGWLAYHYGSWIWNARFGWVWLPDYDWHPGRVVWARGYDTIGWMPAPPPGYDYSRGYLAYIGPENQFSYYDDDFDYYDDDEYSYGGPYYDPRYRDLYYNSNYQQIGINLWVFIGNANFGYDNYADYYLDQEYTRYAFDRRVIRISSRPVERTVIERVVKQRIIEVPVEEREIDTDKKRIRVIVPVGGEEEKVRKNANRTVKDFIAPGFAEKQKTFKGEKSKNRAAVARIFKQENKAPKVETVNSDVIIQQAEQVKKTREVRRIQNVQKEKQQVEKIEKEGKGHQPKEAKKKKGPEPSIDERDSRFQQEKKPKKQIEEVEEPEEAKEPSPYKKQKKQIEAGQPKEAEEANEAPYKKQKKVKEETEYPSEPAEQPYSTVKKKVEEEAVEADEEESEEEAVEDSEKDKSASKKKADSKKKEKDEQEKSKKKKKEKPEDEDPN